MSEPHRKVDTMPQVQCAALQAYTVRDLTSKDFAGTMKKVAGVGYKFVELAGYGNLKTAREARKALDDAGLKPISGHYAIDLLEGKIEQVTEDAMTLGIDTVVCPFLPEPRRKTADDYKKVAESLQRAGEQLHGQGIILGYHNHDFEFKKFGDKTGLELIFDNTPAHLVCAEVDVYWVKFAGSDPVALIDRLGDRVRLLHLKDITDESQKHFAPVGTGKIDFKAVLDAAGRHDVRYGIVEQDNTYGAPVLEAIGTSLENLRKLEAA